MKDLNAVLLGGRVGKNVRFDVLDSGIQLFRFDLANHVPGPKGQRTNWVRVAVVGGLAEPLARKCTPGTPVVLRGVLEVVPKPFREEGEPPVRVRSDELLVIGSSCGKCPCKTERADESIDLPVTEPIELTEAEMREAEALGKEEWEAWEAALKGDAEYIELLEAGLVSPTEYEE